jgi:tetratricopeptide (TPR) repeat protein
MGTHAYMPPEQARGEIEHIDARSDVFGLGAILCEILTGQPPYTGRSANEVRARAECADLREALERLERCGTDAELVGLAQSCLAGEKETRPLDAGAVAAAVTAYQEAVQARLRQAELERGAAQARAEEARATAAAERKARRRALGLGAAVTALLGLGLGGGLWLQGLAAERRTEETRREAVVEAAGQQVAALEEIGHWSEARAILAQAREHLGTSGPAALQRRLQQVQADLDLVEAFDAARLRAAMIVENKLDVPGAEEAYRRALQDSGLGEVGDDVATVARRIQASAVGPQVVAALDDWATLARELARQDWLLAVTRQADHDDWRDRLRDPKLRTDRAALQRLATEAPIDKLPASTLTALARLLITQGGDAVPLLRAAELRYRQDFWVHFELGDALVKAQQREESIGCYRAALALRPQTPIALYNLGCTLQAKGQVDEAIAHYQQALLLDPKIARVHTNLGIVLYEKGRVKEAIGHYEQALQSDPNLFEAHSNLGLALAHNGRMQEAIAHYRQALQLDPKNAKVHTNLGLALHAEGKVDEAIAHHEEALRLDSKLSPAHNNLGLALKDKGRLDEAITHYRQAIDLDPKNAKAHTSLGIALKAKDQVEQAIGHYQQAIQLNPKYAPVHVSLGNALRDKGRLDEAITHYQKAIQLDAKDPLVHTNLGNALYDKRQMDEAIVHYQQAIQLDPKYANAHGALGQTLLGQGRFQEARDATNRCMVLLPAASPIRPLVARQLQQCEQFLALEGRLPAVLRDDDKPRPAQRLLFANLCVQTKRYAAAARLFATALVEHPQLGDDRQAQHRYNAACAASLAACGQGKDAVKLTDKEKTGLRQQAQDWLRADLTAWAKVSDRALVQRTLLHWQKDADLASVRDKEALAKLPPAERKAWQQLWTDVAALLQQSEAQPAPANPTGR